MKKRIISAIILLIITIPSIIVGGLLFKLLVGLIGVLGYKEFIELKGIRNYPKSIIGLGLLSLMVITFSNRIYVFNSIGLDYKYLSLVFILMFTPTLLYYKNNKYSFNDALSLTSFIIFLGLVLNLAINILIYSKGYFWMILLITILTDTFAYFTGMMIGKHKFSKISPNKTIEGCVGGALMGTIITSIYYMTFIGASPLYKVVLVLLCLSIACEIGDLVFSLIKRENKIKDFSNLIPGHGGVLDRIDSLSFVIITYTLLSTFI